MLPVIAIVGRPNVGKSTLFNRLTRSRDAIISSEPNTTRDRQFGEVTLFDRHFILVDTGGMTEEGFVNPKNNSIDMKNLINKQAMQALDEADKILFVVDARDDITPEDLFIAKILRRQAKPIILAVNKTEGLDHEISIVDAFQIGLSSPIPISAAHGKGIEDLITALFPEIISDEPSQDTHAIKLAIVGRPNVGKSTLTNRLLGEERVIVHDEPGTTRDSIFIPLLRFGKHYILIDTAGVRKRKNVSETPEKFSIVKTLQAIENANIVIYVIDANLGVTDQDLKLLGFVLECGKGMVLAINKWDGLSEQVRNHAKATIDRQLDFVDFARIHFISALHGSGVGNLFDSVNEAYDSATKKLSTPQLSRLLQQAQTTHSPPLVKGRRIKLRYAHAGGHNPPCVIIHGNQLRALPESYRKFLARFFQKKLKLYGTPLKIQFKTSDNPFAKK